MEEEVKILLTGGTGYIGSHLAVRLLEIGHAVAIMDNLANSKKEVIGYIKEITGKKPDFFELDMLDYDGVREVFGRENFDLVIHLAGLKSVKDSVIRPLEYYDNNVTGTINLLKCMQEYGVKRIIFSSSATVYGDNGVNVVDETMETGRNIANPYGRTKYMIEEILKDVARADDSFEVILLRYFNPVGAHNSGLLGENPNNEPNNLMPVIMKVASGEIPELQVYGDDYDTPDGSGIRDYIHVMDLVEGHVAAIQKLQPGVEVYNLGTGKGTSVLEMVKMFEKISEETLPYKIVARREGDLAEVIADPSKANKELKWSAEHSIEDAITDTLNYLRKRS